MEASCMDVPDTSYWGPAMEALGSGNSMLAMHINAGYRLAETRSGVRYPSPACAIAEADELRSPRGDGV